MEAKTLTDEEVRTLFRRLRIAYGSAFSAKWQGIPMEEVMRDWALRLGVYSGDAEALGYGLEHLPHDFPPTAMAFAALCESAVRQRTQREMEAAQLEYEQLVTPAGKEWVWVSFMKSGLHFSRKELRLIGSGLTPTSAPDNARKKAEKIMELRGKLHLMRR